MSETKLLPCPFCGAVPDVDSAYVRCVNEGCPATASVPSSAITAWNIRARDPRIAAADAMAKALEAATHELESYVDCSDGCTCGDGWNHADSRIVANAQAALAAYNALQPKVEA